ncbi:MAG: FecR domain-containing protein [Spirochaetales bacterium]|nr:FecR domain-containing protein [Spirochaetales bacterium]
MKKWIRRLSDKDFSDIFSRLDALEKVPEHLDENVLAGIRQGIDDEGEQKKSGKITVFIPILAAAALLVVLLVPIGLYFLQRPPGKEIAGGETVSVTVSLVANMVTRIAEEKEKDLEVRDTIREGTSIATGRDSECELHLDDRARLTVRQNSTIGFSRLTPAEINVEIADGGLVIDSKDPAIEIHTPYAIIRTIGTRYLVEHSIGNGTFVAVAEGKLLVTITAGSPDGRSIECTEGEGMRVWEDGRFKKEEAGEALDRKLEAVIATEPLKPVHPKKEAELTIDGSGTMTLILDDRKRATFKDRISVTLPAGRHDLRLEKEGFVPYRATISFSEGERKTIGGLEFKPIRKKRVWSSSLLYRYDAGDEAEERAIIGFADASDLAVAVTGGALIGFMREEKKWEKIYGKSKGTYFMAMPSIYGNNVYISSYNDNKLLVLDAETGREIRSIDAPGYMSYGSRMVSYNQRIYLPFGSGIYSLVPGPDTIDPAPVYGISSPTTPVFENSRVYVSSLTNEIIVLFSPDGKRKSVFTTKNKSYCSVAVIGKTVFFGDNGGLLYILDENLKEIKTASLPGGIASISGRDNGSCFIFTMAGDLFLMETHAFTVRHFISIDSRPDPNGYYYKRPLFSDGLLLIGTDKGEVIIIDTETKTIEKRLPVSGSPIRCSLSEFGDSFLAGTASGEVFLIQYEEREDGPQ